MSELRSERVVIQSPTSYTGSARRLWRMTRTTMALVPVAVSLIALAWLAVTFWYLTFGVIGFPWRILRRGQRRRKQDMLRHRELLGR